MFFDAHSESDDDSIPETFERFHSSRSLTDDYSYSSDNNFKLSPNQQLQKSRTSQRVTQRRRKKVQNRLDKEFKDLAQSTDNKCANVIHKFNDHAKKYCEANFNYTADPSQPIWKNKQDWLKKCVSQNIIKLHQVKVTMI